MQGGPAWVVVSIGNSPGTIWIGFAPPYWDAWMALLAANAGVVNNKAISIKRFIDFLLSRAGFLSQAGVYNRFPNRVPRIARPEGVLLEALHETDATKAYNTSMRYLVRAKVRPGGEQKLLQAIEDETLGRGSVAEGEYLRNMKDARLCDDGTARWVEVCYCPTPLQEERPYWEEHFELTKIQDAHDRSRCRDQNGSEPWSCGECDCTERLEKKLASRGKPFLQELKHDVRIAKRGFR